MTPKKRGAYRAKPVSDTDNDEINLLVGRPTKRPRNEVEAVIGRIDTGAENRRLRNFFARQEAKEAAIREALPPSYARDKWVSAASARTLLGGVGSSTLLLWRRKGMLDAIQLTRKTFLYSMESINNILSARYAKQRAD